MKITPRMVGATVGALAALGLGNAGLAWAQEAPTTTTPPTTQAPKTDAPDRYCDKDKATDGSSSGSRVPAGDQTNQTDL